MTQARVKFTTFEDYLSCSDETLIEGRYELVDGELTELSPESRLNPEHLELTQRRLTITLDMAPLQLIVEVVSPDKTNRDRDYIRKRTQYAAIGVPEHWLIDPVAQTVMVLSLEEKAYREIGVFNQPESIVSVEFVELELTAKQLF
jgi:Uma2 family endonuclease